MSETNLRSAIVEVLRRHQDVRNITSIADELEAALSEAAIAQKGVTDRMVMAAGNILIGHFNAPEHAIYRAARLALEAVFSAEESVKTVRHKKRGTAYEVIGVGKMQSEDWASYSDEEGYSSVDMREVTIYRSRDDGKIWVRPREEFEDGRFEPLTSLTQAAEPVAKHVIADGVRDFLGKVQGVCMGVAMSGRNHPNPDGVLMDLAKEAQQLLFPSAETKPQFAAEVLDGPELCPICAVPFKPDDLCATDITEGTCHAACLEGAAVVDLDTLEEIEGGTIRTYLYSDVMAIEAAASRKRGSL